MIICNECEHLKRLRRTERVNSNFIEVHRDCYGKPVGFGSLVESPIICQHEVCFETHNDRTPENGNYTYTVRIAGQAQLNADNDCKYFTEKIGFWKSIFK